MKTRAWMVATAVAVAATGCLAADPTPGSCSGDSECPGDEACTRTSECVPGGAMLRIVLRWTVNGVAPSPTAPAPCATVGELEVRFDDPADPEGTVDYRPVPCELGRTTYDKMPPRLSTITLVAWSGTGDRLDSAERPLEPSGESTVDIDLRP